MRRLIKAILLTIVITCAGVSIYFIITIVGNRDIVVNAYNNLSNTNQQGADVIRTNFLQVYGTYGEELFIALGISKTDYAPGGVGDSDPGAPDGSENKICTCTDRCTSDSDFDDTCEICKHDWNKCAYVPPCTCSGTDRCNQTTVDQTCDACKISYINCKVSIPNTTGGEIGGDYEGTWNHVQQCTETYTVTSVHGTANQHCFFVAMNALCSGLTSRAVTLEEVFKADGQTWVCDPSTMVCKTSKDHNGSIARGNTILNNMGVSKKLDNTCTSVTLSGTYIVYTTNNDNWSSGGNHWFTIHDGVLMTNAGNHDHGYELTASDIADINGSLKHIGKVE